MSTFGTPRTAGEPLRAENIDGIYPDVWWTPVGIDGPTSLEPRPYPYVDPATERPSMLDSLPDDELGRS